MTGHVLTSSLSPPFLHVSLPLCLLLTCPFSQQNVFRLQEAGAQVRALLPPARSMFGGQSKFPVGCPRTHCSVSLGSKRKQLQGAELPSRFPHSALLTSLSVLASACSLCDWGRKRRPHRTRRSEAEAAAAHPAPSP